MYVPLSDLIDLISSFGPFCWPRLDDISPTPPVDIQLARLHMAFVFNYSPVLRGQRYWMHRNASPGCRPL